MTDDEIRNDRKICNAATPGPWTREKPPREDGWSLGVAVAATAGRQMIYARPPGGSFPSADANFIAAARTRWPAALDEVMAQREVIGSLGGTVGELSLENEHLRAAAVDAARELASLRDANAELQRQLEDLRARVSAVSGSYGGGG